MISVIPVATSQLFVLQRGTSHSDLRRPAVLFANCGVITCGCISCLARYRGMHAGLLPLPRSRSPLPVRCAAFVSHRLSTSLDVQVEAEAAFHQTVIDLLVVVVFADLSSTPVPKSILQEEVTRSIQARTLFRLSARYFGPRRPQTRLKRV